MLDDLRNLFGDMLTGKMKDSEIALTKQESAILRLKIEGFIAELSKLRDERAVFASRLEDQRLQLAEKDSLITDLTAKLDERKPVEDRLDDPTHEVLKLLFNVDEGLDLGTISSHFDRTQGVAMFHLDTLKDLDFIGHKRGRTAPMGLYSGSQNLMRSSTSDTFFIKPKGRAYIMKNG